MLLHNNIHVVTRSMSQITSAEKEVSKPYARQLTPTDDAPSPSLDREPLRPVEDALPLSFGK